MIKRVAFLLALGNSFLLCENFITPLPYGIDANSHKAQLGEKLFFETRLSKDGNLSCASCHKIAEGGDDGRPLVIGFQGQKSTLNTPTVLNSALNFKQFWDGSADDLQSQLDEHLKSQDLMHTTLDKITLLLNQDKEYQELFQALYPDGITPHNITDAIVEFEKTLLTPNAPFDQYLRGDKGAISDRAQKGYSLFISKGCVICHHGVIVGGNMFSKFGIYEKIDTPNKGRYDVTKNDEDINLFKVPSLRNITRTGPYMHDGRIKNLRDAVALMARLQLGRYMTSQEIDDIVAFLYTLNGKIPTLKEH